eukprot:1117748-Pyramimonas_sp.AAC.1
MVGVPIQEAGVPKVSGSAREMVEPVNCIVLDRDAGWRRCSYLEHRATGQRTTTHEENSDFQFAVRDPKAERDQKWGKYKEHRAGNPRGGLVLLSPTEPVGPSQNRDLMRAEGGGDG